jgi:hypothetical protein
MQAFDPDIGIPIVQRFAASARIILRRFAGKAALVLSMSARRHA